MEDHTLRYAPPEDVIRFAREKGWSTVRIVRTVSGALSHREAFKVARLGAVAPFIRDRIYETGEKRMIAIDPSTAQSSLRYSRLGEACRS